ncbi:MAG TPA: L,D-transpeptidase [Bauldia sp.]|nr:L,D-transpeptidase [Bauldia sp.]
MTDRPLFPTRRAALAGIAGAAAGAILARPALADLAEEARKLKPGQFTWQPELQPRGPVSIIVSIKEQLLHVHRKGKRIGVSTVSTGKPGHSTPIGVFTILQKREEHVSSIYGSEMPFMQRLTWSGIALHAGALPGYPASHGCVRLPLQFAELLYGVTKLGTPVVIANRFSDPNPVVSMGIAGRRFTSAELGGGFATRARAYQDGEPEPRPVTSVLVSRQDNHAIVLENGAIVAEGPVTISDPGTPFPTEVFVLNGAETGGDGLSWEAIGYGEGEGPGGGALVGDVMDRIKGPENVAAAIAERLAPGMILIVTEDRLTPETRSDGDFVVMTAEEGSQQGP